MIDFLDWIVRAGGLIAVLVVTLGFIFREKWKQILQRSLAEDLEMLKSELAKSQAEHAASLTPQLEQIKHDFQQKLEAYKVSLIAETEAVKAKGELRKSIALRYVEIEFERLVALEHVMAPITSELLGLASIDVNYKSIEDTNQALEQFRALRTATNEAEMFMSPEDVVLINEFHRQLIDITKKYVGHGKPVFPDNHEAKAKLIGIAARVHNKLKERIGALGKL